MCVVMDTVSVVKAGVDSNVAACSDLLHRRPDKALMSTNGESLMAFVMDVRIASSVCSGRT